MLERSVRLLLNHSRPLLSLFLSFQYSWWKIKKIASDWIRTVDLWCWTLLSHNHCPLSLFTSCYVEFSTSFSLIWLVLKVVFSSSFLLLLQGGESSSLYPLSTVDVLISLRLKMDANLFFRSSVPTARTSRPCDISREFKTRQLNV